MINEIITKNKQNGRSVGIGAFRNLEIILARGIVCQGNELGNYYTNRKVI